jgi:hypothetical protein
MNFKCIDVSSLGPFPKNQKITFHPGINVIQGGNGTGKTTIFLELIRNYLEKHQIQKIDVELELNLVFIDGSSPREADINLLASAANHTHGQTLFNSRLSAMISNRLNEYIRRKTAAGLSKFGELSKSGYPFSTLVSENGIIRVLDSSGRMVDSAFAAMGERFAMMLAWNLAVRDLIGFDNPIVIDGGPLDVMEVPFMEVFLEQLISQGSQCILLAPERRTERLFRNPDYVLEWDKEMNQSKIVRSASI